MEILTAQLYNSRSDRTQNNVSDIPYGEKIGPTMHF